MTTLVPADYADLLDDAMPATLILTTLRRDGMPVLAPIWFVAEGEALFGYSSEDAPRSSCDSPHATA
jgi:hypothetical protein